MYRYRIYPAGTLLPRCTFCRAVCFPRSRSREWGTAFILRRCYVLCTVALGILFLSYRLYRNTHISGTIRIRSRTWFSIQAIYTINRDRVAATLSVSGGYSDLDPTPSSCLVLVLQTRSLTLMQEGYTGPRLMYQAIFIHPMVFACSPVQVFVLWVVRLHLENFVTLSPIH